MSQAAGFRAETLGAPPEPEAANIASDALGLEVEIT